MTNRIKHLTTPRRVEGGILPIWWSTQPAKKHSIIWGHNGKVGIGYLVGDGTFIINSNFNYDNDLSANGRVRHASLEAACEFLGVRVPKWIWDI
jgi:hypothetical protein